MRLLTLEAEAFRSYKHLEFNFENQGLTLIKGHNGSGKSTIIDGVLFALFGVGTDDIVNDRICKNTYVSLTGEHNGHTFTVGRARKHHKHKNNVFLWIDDNPVPASTNRKVQKKIEEFLGLDYKSFINIASFSSDMQMFCEATDTERKQIFERILPDIDKYKEYAEEAKALLYDVHIKMGNINDDNIAIESEMSVYSKMATVEQERAKTFEKEKLQQCKILQGRIEKLNKQALEKEDLTKMRDKYERVVIKLHKFWEDIHTDEETMLDTDVRVQVLQQKITALEKTNECSECFQKVTAAHKKKHIPKWEKEMLVLINKNKDLKENFRKAQKVKQKVEQLNSKVDAMQMKIIHLQPEGEMADVEYELTKTLESVNEHETMAKEFSDRIGKFKRKRTQNKKVMRALEEEEIYLNEVIKGYSKEGIVNQIITRALGLLEDRTNKYLDTLTNGAISVEILGNIVTKTGKIRSRLGINIHSNSGVRDFDSFSGGEKQRINIALLLALRDVAGESKGIKIDTLFLDEVLDLSLDTEGVGEVLHLLRTTKDDEGNIIIVSPKAEMVYNTGVEFDNVYSASKADGFSNLK